MNSVGANLQYCADMLSNPFGVLLYLLLRNDISWGLLSKHEKERILRANAEHNTKRNDYANPENYGKGRCSEGENWDTFQLRNNDHRGNTLLEILEQKKPKHVLEVAPGAGFYTRLICKYPTVRSYTAVDISKPFLNYLKPRLDEISLQKPFKYNLIHGEITEVVLTEKKELIVLFSAVHHIPNRIQLFENLVKLLLNNGLILCFDPSHYVLRIRKLLKKCFSRGYLKKGYYLDRRKLSTHHMCSLGEYKKIVRKIPSLRISKVVYKLPNKVSNYKWLFIPNNWFSTEIGIVLERLF